MSTLSLAFCRVQRPKDGSKSLISTLRDQGFLRRTILDIEPRTQRENPKYAKPRTPLIGAEEITKANIDASFQHERAWRLIASYQSLVLTTDKLFPGSLLSHSNDVISLSEIEKSLLNYAVLKEMKWA